MGCCSPFTAVTTASAADPSRHVNFTAGMVLGVDDYRQEFAYHSARDKWIVRDFLGYGTLSGLALSVEDNADGPRIRVTPGAAAAPSGQLICVGREQCGGLNAWLARKEVADKIAELVADSPDPTQAALNVFVTLCYVDCAVADVPIPGEPCRSDENLMAPSRIADDYSLGFAWEAPPQAEFEAQAALETILTRLDIKGTNPSGPEDFANALRVAELQLQLLLGIYPPDALEPDPADLTVILLHTEMEMRFRTALKTLWVTRLRPRVAAQRCGTDSVPAHDCVLLGQLWFPVINDSNSWQVYGTANDVAIDESARPVLLSAAVAQSSFGKTVIEDSSGLGFEFITSDGNISSKVRMAVVRSDVAVEVKVPSASKNPGTELSIKAGGKGEVTVATPNKTTIDGRNKLKLAVRGAVSLVSDGVGGWHITGLLK
jgi:hypothetical protein